MPVVNGPKFDPDSISYDAEAQWVIGNYDYSRAKILLNKFINEEIGRGPYIVSVKERISCVNRVSQKYLFQDLSDVHPSLASIWMDEFLKQSKRQTFWDEEELDNLKNDLRNGIAKAGEGLNKAIIQFGTWKAYLSSKIFSK